MFILICFVFILGFVIGKSFNKLKSFFIKPKKLEGFKKDDNKNTYGFSDNDDLKMVFCVRQDLKMGCGKIAAQVGHATISLFEEITSSNNIYQREALNYWYNNCQKKIVLKVPNESIMSEIKQKLRNNNIKYTAIHDAGHTQIPAGSLTVIGIGPDASAKIDQITGNLKLYN